MRETLHLLVVDDEPGMRSSVERALRNYVTRLTDVEAEVGFRISQAESGEAALDLWAEDAPDLVLLDYKLPGMTGLDVLGTLQERRSEALVVMMTAYASLETAVQATRIGAYDFLAKPFTPEELKAVVHKATKHCMIQRRVRKLAEERRQIRFAFLSILAHELKSPIAAVEGNLFILRDHLSGDALQAYDHLVERSLLRLDGMKKLIFDLLDLTRIESGQRQRELVEADLGEVALRALETAQPVAVAQGIKLSWRLAGTVRLQADLGELEIILNNLLSNAIKYNRVGGSVALDVWEEGPEVRIRVADTGIGMTAEEMGKLFGEFSRIKNEQTRNILGSGLGLSIIKRLAHLYAGTVTVESEPGKGSTFTVVLSKASSATPLQLSL
jgi:two-component system, sensor histidine kinase and response regulator